jgi:hypothetical protein
LKLGALDLEVIMGVSPRGSFCRDTLELSRLIDVYSSLAVPLQLTMAIPAQAGDDDLADSDLKVGLGCWRDSFSNASQADWTKSFVRLGLCKPLVRCVQWPHLSDAVPHQYPHCGLIDREGKVREAQQPLAELREKYLR